MDIEFNQLLRTIGCFSVISQIVLHFLSNEEYSKYAKLLTAFILLTMLALPIMNLKGKNVSDMITYKSQEFEMYLDDYGQINTSDNEITTVLTTEQELTKVLSGKVMPYGYYVTQTRIQDEKLTITLKELNRNAKESKSSLVNITPVNISSIELGNKLTQNNELLNQESNSTDSKQKVLVTLLDVLRTSEEYLEVIYID